MPASQEIEARFWKALRSDMTVMLGLHGVDDGHSRPMTAQLDGDEGPIWFFTASDSALFGSIGQGNSRALCTFVSKGNDVFASVHGTLVVDNDRAMIEKLWNPHIAAWYEGGKGDPKIVLLRLDADRGEIWLDASSLVAGIKMLLGADPKKDYQDKVAKVDLS